MAPVTAAYVGVSIEVLGGVLLAMGLMTRYAAVPMLILSVVIQVEYLPFDNQLFWVALLGWYAVYGAGPISIDALLRRGLADSALPFAPNIVRASEWVRVNLGPLYLSAMRVWLSVALLLPALQPAVMDGRRVSDFALWLPLNTTAQVPYEFGFVGGALLLLGIATRYVGISMILALTLNAMDLRLTDAGDLLLT